MGRRENQGKISWTAGGELDLDVGRIYWEKQSCGILGMCILLAAMTWAESVSISEHDLF